MATNRADTLDPALLRPGRLDRKIEFPNPSRREKRLIFQTVTSKMNLGPDVDLEDCTSAMHALISRDGPVLSCLTTGQALFCRDRVYSTSRRLAR